MKGKRYTTEEKIRILREADSAKGILEVCRDHNISEVSFSPLEAAIWANGGEGGPPIEGPRAGERRVALRT
jgi:transposase-like protein